MPRGHRSGRLRRIGVGRARLCYDGHRVPGRRFMRRFPIFHGWSPASPVVRLGEALLRRDPHAHASPHVQPSDARWGRHSCLPFVLCGSTRHHRAGSLLLAVFCSRAARARTTGRAGSPLMRFCSPSAVVGCAALCPCAATHCLFVADVPASTFQLNQLMVLAVFRAVWPAGHAPPVPSWRCSATRRARSNLFPRSLAASFRLRRRSWGLRPSQFYSCPQAAGCFHPSVAGPTCCFPSVRTRRFSALYMYMSGVHSRALTAAPGIDLRAIRTDPHGLSRTARIGRYCLGFTVALSGAPVAWDVT